MLSLAHVKWFVDANEYPDIDLLPDGLLLLAVSIIVLGLITAYYLDLGSRGLMKKLDRYTQNWRGWLPLLVGLPVGISLIIASFDGYLIAPNITDVSSLWILLQFLIGLSWLLGLGVRYTSLLALLLYIPLSLHGFVSPLEHLEILGTAVFLAAFGRGPWSLDRAFGIDRKLDYEQTRAGDLYRISIGASLVTLALSEKLLAYGLAKDFLADHNWNFLAWAGASDETFIAVIGSLELLFGLLVILNLATRWVVLAILATMTITAALLGISEVYGHLFAVGLVAYAWLTPVKSSRKS